MRRSTRKTRVSRYSALALLFFLPASSGCGSSSGPPSPPASVSCATSIDGGGDAGSLASALSAASAGSCVLAKSATYSGTFVVPAGVTLASALGEHAIFVSDSASAPAIELTGGQGTGLAEVDVDGAAGVGVAVRGGGATIVDVNVTQAGSAALAVLCTDAGSCAVELDNVTLTKSALGLWVSGASVTMNHGASTDHTTTTLTGGIGIVAQKGAKLTLDGVDVERNAGIGVLLDGAGGTTAVLQDVTVSNNLDRGIWAQGLTGTSQAPALTIQGATDVENNRIVGVGSVASQGIIFVGGRVANTQTAPVLTNLGTTDQVGDGVGLFGGSGQVEIQNVEVSNNQRAAGLIDGAAGAIIFVGGKVEPGPSGLGIVVQNSANQDVQVPAGDLTAGSAVLGVSAPTVALTSVLQ
jgi:parallel beta helix pectate lyase-like protein